MDIYFSEQFKMITFAFSTGAILSIIFDIFRIIRLTFRHNAFFVAIEDILYTLIALYTTVIYFSTFNSGQIRGYLLFSMAAGFGVCHFTIGRIIIFLSKLILKVIKRILRVFFYPLRFILKKFCKFFKKFNKFLKKPFIFTKKHCIIIKEFFILRKEGGVSGGKSKNKRHKSVRKARFNSIDNIPELSLHRSENKNIRQEKSKHKA